MKWEMFVFTGSNTHFLIHLEKVNLNKIPIELGCFDVIFCKFNLPIVNVKFNATPIEE